MDDQSKKLQERLGVKFKNPDLLQIAITHRSYLNEHKEIPEHNERLEFLGDAVLELVVTDALFHRLPQTAEGKMTSIRAALVRKENLVKASELLDLGKYLRLSNGEEQTGGRTNSYILANTVEALIGAVYLDQGIVKARQIVHRFILPFMTEILENELYLDAKSHLQEIAQEKLKLTPVYEVLSESGPDHLKTFRAGVYLGGALKGQGEGRSKRGAELKAAQDALIKLKW